MSSDSVTVRINFSAGEVEVSGSNALVKEWLEKLDTYVKEFGQRHLGAACQVPPRAHGSQALTVTAPAQIPEVFGEYYHQFPSSISDVDRVLIAGRFLEGTNPDGAFSTREARALLEAQRIHVSNVSECVKRNQAARRVFSVETGRFRVSASGLEYLGSLSSS